MNQVTRNPNKIWVDKGSEFYNRSMKSWFQDNDIETYSMYKEGKSVFADRFIRTFKDKIYRYMTSVLKNVYINKFGDIVNKYNNIYHNTTKMKPVDVKSSTYIDSGKENNEKDPKFDVGDHVKRSKYKNIFAKGCFRNWSEEVFVIKKVKTTVLWTYVSSDLNGEGIIGMFYEKELQKTSQDKIFIKWKGYNNFLTVGLTKRT